MRKFSHLLLGISLCASLHARAQDNNYDALARTFSQTGPSGSARFQAIGGTHAALGADASTLIGNPAGMGFYTRSELNFTPGAAFQKNDATYLGNTRSDSKGNFNLGNLGIIFAGNRTNPVTTGRWRGGAIGLGYTRSYGLNNSISFGGTNNQSSQADAFAEEANREANSSGITVQDFRDDLNQNGNTFDFPTSMYYYGFLIDPNSQNGPPYSGAEPRKATNQTFRFSATGATSQWTLAYGASYDDKLYLGASLGLARMRYTTTKTTQEQFTNPTQIQGFTFENSLNTRGGGINFAVGAIYRPVDFLRIGASITSPTWFNISETTESNLQVSLARPIDVGPSNANDPQLTNLLNRLSGAGYRIATQNGRTVIGEIPRLAVKPFDSQYQLRTPFKANGGVAVFFGKAAFISGNVEYVAYEGMRLSSNDQNADGDLQNGSYTDDVKRQYQNVLNYKLGGEYRIQNIHLRAGLSYYADPYKQTFDDLDRTRTIYSAGIGYRTDKFYVDVAGLYGKSSSAYSPYVLNNTADYGSATINNATSQVVLSVGTYF
ncbi:MAG: hypothetical protein LH606_05995 [Cytophagaceae bacterium]|nr:hypothetical protein [Cytophagaceae bacterium]